MVGGSGRQALVDLSRRFLLGGRRLRKDRSDGREDQGRWGQLTGGSDSAREGHCACILTCEYEQSSTFQVDSVIWAKRFVALGNVRYPSERVETEIVSSVGHHLLRAPGHVGQIGKGSIQGDSDRNPRADQQRAILCTSDRVRQ